MSAYHVEGGEGTNHDEDSTGSSKEALDLFLGGIDTDAFKEADWNGPEEEEAGNGEVAIANDEQVKDIQSPRMNLSQLGPLDANTQSVWKELLTRAHAVCPSSGALQAPPVRIVNMVS